MFVQRKAPKNVLFLDQSRKRWLDQTSWKPEPGKVSNLRWVSPRSPWRLEAGLGLASLLLTLFRPLVTWGDSQQRRHNFSASTILGSFTLALSHQQSGIHCTRTTNCMSNDSKEMLRGPKWSKAFLVKTWHLLGVLSATRAWMGGFPKIGTRTIMKKKKKVCWIDVHKKTNKRQQRRIVEEEE